MRFKGSGCRRETCSRPRALRKLARASSENTANMRPSSKAPSPQLRGNMQHGMQPAGLPSCFSNAPPFSHATCTHALVSFAGMLSGITAACPLSRKAPLYFAARQPSMMQNSVMLRHHRRLPVLARVFARAPHVPPSRARPPIMSVSHLTISTMMSVNVRFKLTDLST